MSDNKNFTASDIKILRAFWNDHWGNTTEEDRALHLLKFKPCHRDVSLEERIVAGITKHYKGLNIEHLNWYSDILIFSGPENDPIPGHLNSRPVWNKIEVYTIDKRGISFEESAQQIWIRGGFQEASLDEKGNVRELDACLEIWFGVEPTGKEEVVEDREGKQMDDSKGKQKEEVIEEKVVRGREKRRRDNKKGKRKAGKIGEEFVVPNR